MQDPSCTIQRRRDAGEKFRNSKKSLGLTGKGKPFKVKALESFFFEVKDPLMYAKRTADIRYGWIRRRSTADYYQTIWAALVHFNLDDYRKPATIDVRELRRYITNEFYELAKSYGYYRPCGEGWTQPHMSMEDEYGHSGKSIGQVLISHFDGQRVRAMAA